MSAPSNKKLFLYDIQTLSKFAEVEGNNIDVFFPDPIQGWSDVLDCRVGPYPDQSIEENCHFAAHVHKKYILVSEDQVSKTTPI